MKRISLLMSCTLAASFLHSNESPKAAPTASTVVEKEIPQVTDEPPQNLPTNPPTDSKENVTQADRYKVEANMGNGTTIQLKDGSIWKIAEVDRFKTARWLPGDNLSITTTGYTSPPYTLTNSTNRSRTLNIDNAGAEMIQGPTKKIKG